MKITTSKLNAKLADANYRVYTNLNIIFHPYNPLVDVIIVNVDNESISAIFDKNKYSFKDLKFASGFRPPLTKSLSFLLIEC